MSSFFTEITGFSFPPVLSWKDEKYFIGRIKLISFLKFSLQGGSSAYDGGSESYGQVNTLFFLLCVNIAKGQYPG